MKVDISKYWIEGAIEDKYPQFTERSGADLDGNGLIAGGEVFSDLNHNGTIGDPDDYQLYLKMNRAALSAAIPFFKYGEKLSVKNRIHQLIYLESDLHDAALVQSAYRFLGRLTDKVRHDMQGKHLTHQQEASLIYAVMQSKMGIAFKMPHSPSFIANIQEKRMDCDTSSYTVLAVGDELGIALGTALAPNHVFLKGVEDDGSHFNIDYDYTLTDDSYRQGYSPSISPKTEAQGSYLSTNTYGQTVGLFLSTRGYILGDLGKHEEALGAHTQAAQLNPYNVDTQCYRGNELYRLGRFEEALSAYTHAAYLNPDYAFAHYNRGYVLEEMGRFEEALATLTRAIQLNPNDAATHNVQGHVLNTLGRFEEALSAYTHATHLNPDYAMAHYNRGCVLEEMGRLEEALAAFTHAAKLNPNDSDAHDSRAQVLEKIRTLNEAIATYNRATKKVATVYNFLFDKLRPALTAQK